jgi:sodium/potassium-transporting ATPase subunit alpha
VNDNLKKVTVYLLPAGSWSEMLPVIANVFLGVPLPLSPFLMIVICILTDLFPSLALVNEQPEDEISPCASSGTECDAIPTCDVLRG